MSKSDEIPRRYDAYFFHLSEINEEDIKRLMEDEHFSWIYGQSNATRKYDPESDRVQMMQWCLDRLYVVRSPVEDVRDIIEEIKNFRKPKE